jgi:hypothetical protein
MRDTGPAAGEPGVRKTRETSSLLGAVPCWAAGTRGAAQTIITTAVTSSRSPAAAVSHVDLTRFSLTTGVIFRTRSRRKSVR